MSKKYPTLKEVAQLAGTSVATASYVLSKKEGRYIKSELSQRVLDAAESLNYTKSLIASTLRGSSRRVLTLLVPHLWNLFFAQMTTGIVEYAFRRGYIVNVCNTFDDEKREREIIEQSISLRVDGFLLSGTLNAHENVELIKERDIPFVVFERPLGSRDDSYDYYFVGSNNLQAGKLAGDHLIRNGHKRIAYVEWMRNVLNVTNRRAGLEEALRGHPDVGYFVKSCLALSAKNGYAMTEEILDAVPAPSAVLYGHHKLAEGGIACMLDRGLDIPRKISVMIIGYTDWARLSIPRFTFVSQPVEELSYLASKTVIDLIEKKNQTLLRKPVKRFLDCFLVEGSTVKSV